MANIAKKLNKLNGVAEPVPKKRGAKRTSMRQLRVDAWAEEEARELAEDLNNPPSKCLSLAAEVRKYVKLETKFGARAPETQAQLDVLAPLVAGAKPGLLSLLLRQERS